jgi:cationic amino acid transporter 1
LLLGAWWTIVCLLISVIILIIVTVVIVKQPQNQTTLFFKTPYVPFVPLLSIFLNIIRAERHVYPRTVVSVS